MPRTTELATVTAAGQVRAIFQREAVRVFPDVPDARRGDVWAAVRDVPSLGHLAQRAVIGGRDGELRGVLARALADQTTGGSPGVTTPGVIADVKGIFARSRQAVDAFGRVPLDGSGMSADWPVLVVPLSTIVGEQATQKAEVTSVQVPLTKGSAPVKTYAGGSDVSYQLIRRSSPAYLTTIERIYLAAYAVVTDGAFVSALQGTAGLGSIVIDWNSATARQAQEAAFQASAMVQDATGMPASFVLAGASVFAAIGGILTPSPVLNAPGSGEASSLTPSLSGLRVIYQPAVAADTAIFGNDQGAAWHEDGPYFATEDDVARLGRDVAVWGLGAAAVYIPAGIVKTAPVVGLVAASAKAKAT
jgi:hypothetical protein